MITKFNPDSSCTLEEVKASKIGILYDKIRNNKLNAMDELELSSKLATTREGCVRTAGYMFDFRQWLRKIVYKTISGDWWETYCINKTLFRKSYGNVKDIYYIYNPYNPNEKRRDYN